MGKVVVQVYGDPVDLDFVIKHGLDQAQLVSAKAVTKNKKTFMQAVLDV